MISVLKRGAAVGLVLAMLALTACSAGADGAGDASQADAAGSQQGETMPTADWNEADATKILMDGDSIEVDGNGATVDGSTVTIVAGGIYVLSGTLDDGQVVVDTTSNTAVQLVLNGVSLKSSASAPIYAKQVDELTITLAEGTQNRVEDAASYQYAAGEDEPDAAIFCKDDLVINGNGSLEVLGNFNNGIGTKDDLVITGGSITVEAVNHAMRGRDSVTISGGDFTLTSGNDGIQSNNGTDTGKGWVRIEGGSFNISSAHDGIQAETALDITSGSFVIVSGGGSAYGEEHVDDGPGGGWGGFGGRAPQADANADSSAASDASEATEDASGAATEDTGTAATEDTDDSATSTSYKGLKSGTSLSVSGGSFEINSADDALHTNGDMTVSGGTFTIATGDDAFHADAALVVSGGSIDITECYEGLEGATVTVTDGIINIVAEDDGINAAGGSDSGGTERFGPDSFAGSGDYWVKIEGGTLTIDAGYDGIDSNGDLTITGGTLVINGSPNSIGGDGAIDYEGALEINGATIAGAAQTGFAAVGATTTDGVSQVVLDLHFDSLQSGGTLVTLADAEGNVMMSFAPLRDFQTVILTGPQLVAGETYTVLIGGTAGSEVVGGLYSTASGGTKLVELTLEAGVNALTESGEAYAGGNMPGGMPGNWGADGTMPEMPEGWTEGERPTPPEGWTEGDMPEMPEGWAEGNMPARPGGGQGASESTNSGDTV